VYFFFSSIGRSTVIAHDVCLHIISFSFTVVVVITINVYYLLLKARKSFRRLKKYFDPKLIKSN
jgi:hypothetical protein